MNGKKIPEIFGSMVFSDKVMKERLPSEAYEAVRRAIEYGTPLSHEHAKSVATVMKEWAIEKGATHFTHWFQPMTGITAEKHDSFVEPYGNGDVIMKFSEKSLVKGDVKTASILLGRYFEVTGIVAYGNQVGSKINVPTANILYDDEYVGLAKGVYVTIFEYEGKSYPSITNIGHNPSFNYSNKLSMECHVLNFCLDIYQKEVTIKFVEKIRDEIKFDSVSSFKEQIEKDKIFALNILNNR